MRAYARAHTHQFRFRAFGLSLPLPETGLYVKRGLIALQSVLRFMLFEWKVSNSRRFRVERPWSQALALEYGFVFVPLTIPEPATPTVFAAPQSYDHRPLLQKPPDWSFEIRKRFVCVHNAWSRQVPFSAVSADDLLQFNCD